MKVYELIEKLKGFDPQMNVVRTGSSGAPINVSRAVKAYVFKMDDFGLGRMEDVIHCDDPRKGGDEFDEVLGDGTPVWQGPVEEVISIL
jgi:hypothetical protein